MEGGGDLGSYPAAHAQVRKKEITLAQRAQAHVEEAHSIIGTLCQEIDDAQLVIDLVEERDIF